MTPNEAQHDIANPFGLLLNPQTILKAVETSERLGRLHSRICRPLDRPLIPHADAANDPDVGDLTDGDEAPLGATEDL